MPGIRVTGVLLPDHPSETGVTVPVAPLTGVTGAAPVLRWWGREPACPSPWVGGVWSSGEEPVFPGLPLDELPVPGAWPPQSQGDGDWKEPVWTAR